MKYILLILVGFGLHAESKSELLTSYGLPLKVIEDSNLRQEIWVYNKKSYKFINGVFQPEIIQEVKVENERVNSKKEFKSGVSLFEAFKEADRKEGAKAPSLTNRAPTAPPAPLPGTEFQQELVE